MDYQQVVDHFGGLTKAAKALGLPITTVHSWRSGIPYPRQCQIQIETRGRLRATRERVPPPATSQTLDDVIDAA